MSALRIGAMGLLMIGVSGCGPSAPPSPPIPADEAGFVSAKVQAEANYDQAPNDIARSHISDQWEKDVCKALAAPQSRNWNGTVTSIVSSPDGVIIGLGNDVSVEASLEPGSDLDREVSEMRAGEKVVFSGSFKPGDNGCTVDLIGFPWGDGRIRKPDFDVQLQSIAAA